MQAEQRMQRSAGRPDRVGEHARAPGVEQDEVERARPVALRARPSRATCTGSSARPSTSAGRSCRKTSRSRKRGIAFSIPITVISTSGSVVHMRPLPSDSTTQIVPVSAAAKFAPEIATRARRNASRRWSRAASASSAGSSREVGQPEAVAEEVADLGPVLVDRRHEQMRRALARELDDQLREVGLDRPDARPPRAPR